jgi:hypothetical protein
MSILDSIKRRSAEKEAQKAAQHYEASLRSWNTENDSLQRYLEEVKTLKGATKEDVPEISIQLKKDERVFQIGQGAFLIEPRRGPGHYQGGYSGVSFRVAKGVRLHTGGTRGTFVQGEETPTPIDQGTVTITNQRVVFQGTKQAREWPYNKLISEDHSPDLPWTSLPVSNRQKVSGILYDKENAEQVRFRMALALAYYNNSVDDLVKQIEQEVSAHEAVRPQSPVGLPLALTNESIPPASPQGASQPLPVQEVSTRHCGNGHTMSLDAKFCPECGAPVVN